jgi:uncharacterized protein YqjF (DUF2071 family)
MTGVFLTADWRRLLMFNYCVDAELLRGYTPHGTEVDSWGGNTFISLVAFQFLDTRVKGVPVPFHCNFEEINLRFYVRARAPEGWRRGVVFISEVVPRAAIAAVARWLYNENYSAHATRAAVSDPRGAVSGSVEYGWKVGDEWLTVSAGYSGEPVLPGPGSQEEFITEHYWGYTRQRDGSTVEYRVQHPQWRVWTAHDVVVTHAVAGFYPSGLAAVLAHPPRSAFVAEGSRVQVWSGNRLHQQPAHD